MLKTFAWLLPILLILSYQQLPAQENYATVQGNITDGTTATPIPYATIQLKNAGIGTACNANGVFLFKIPAGNKNDSLVISSIGYKSQTISGNPGRYLQISLQPAAILLNSVTVKSVNALDIIREMLTRLPDNYDTAATRFTAFYREFIRLHADTLNYNESVLGIYKSPYYQTANQNQVRLIKGQRLETNQHGDPRFYGWLSNIMNTAYSSLTEDVARFPNGPKSFLNKDNFDDYHYTYEGILEEGNINLTVISFGPKTAKSEALMTGKLYLESKSLAIVRCEWTTTPSGVRYVNKHGKGGLGYTIMALSLKAKMDFTMADAIISYQQYRGKWYLAGINRHWKIDINSPKRNIRNAPWDGRFTMQVTAIQPDSAQPFSDSTINRNASVNSLIQQRYDTAFWEQHNFQLPESATLTTDTPARIQPDTVIHLSNRKNGFTYADTLRGTLSPLRSCFDVTFYNLNVIVDPDKKTLTGSNEITFKVLQPLTRLQLDLHRNMHISKISWQQKSLTYSRTADAVFISFPETLSANTTATIRVEYDGSPQTARTDLPMWGGMLWQHTPDGDTWAQMVCQGSGASLWWPNKDHQSDEPDSMRIAITVPSRYTEISNGKLLAKTLTSNNQVRYDWLVSYPINNYNVSFCIGPYTHFTDQYIRGKNDTLALDYYVLPAHLAAARQLFPQMKFLLKTYEHYFGPYPFPRDGFRVLESPYPMEHQSGVCVGKLFSDTTQTLLPPIVWHEVAHEWWGNAITSKDIADMWIHEGFATYAEALGIEAMFGKENAVEFLNLQRPAIRNIDPVIGVYNVNHIHYDIGDMYSKASLMLHTLRSCTQNDSLWFRMIRAIQEKFRYQTITSDTLESFISKALQHDYRQVFQQYLRETSIPVLEYHTLQQGPDLEVNYRWKNVIPGFDMPVAAQLRGKTNMLLFPTTSPATLKIKNIKSKYFQVDDQNFLINVEH